MELSTLEKDILSELDSVNNPTVEDTEEGGVVSSTSSFEDDILSEIDSEIQKETEAVSQSEEQYTQVKDADGNIVNIDRDVMVRNNPDPRLAHKTRIALGDSLEELANIAEMPFQVTAGAIDEVTAMLGRDTSKSGAYPLQKIVDDIIRFDETVEWILPKADRKKLTPGDFALSAFARGATTGAAITGSMISQGSKALTPALGSELSAGQQATIARGSTLRTPSDVLGANTALIPGGDRVARSTVLQRTAADPKTAMQADVLFTGAGTVGAGLGAMSQENQGPEAMAEAAAKGELIGIGTSLASPIVKTMATKGPVGFASKYAWSKSEPVRDVLVSLFDRQAFQEMTLKQKINPKNWKDMISTKAIEKHGRRDVLEHMDRFLRTDEVKDRVTMRLKAIDSLNETLKKSGSKESFQPGFGALVGTEESIAFQQMTDYHNYEFALRMQEQNQRALNAAKSIFAKDPSFKYGDDLADMFEMMAKDTQSLLDVMEGKMDDVASSLIEQTFANAGVATKEGSLLRNHYENMQLIYNKMRDDMYSLVKVPSSIKFKVDPLDTKIQELLRLDVPDSVVGSNLSILEKILPRALKSLGDKKVMDYDTLDSFRKRLGKEYASLKATDPYSPHLNTLNEVRIGIDKIINKGIDSLPDEFSHIKTARDNAKRFFNEELVPRYRQGSSSDVLSLNVDGTRKISDDSLMNVFWERGDKTEGAKEFNKIFRDFADVDSKYFSPDDISTLSREADEAKEGLYRYALGTLETDLKAAGKAGAEDPTKVLERWRLKYRGALSQFPDIDSRLNTTEKMFEAVAENARQFKEQRVNLANNIISKYTRTNPESVVKTFLSSRREAQNTLDLIESVYGTDPKKVEEIQNALGVVVINKIINSSVDPVTKKFNYRQVARLMEEGNDVLPLLIGQDDLRNLVDFNASLGIIKDQPAILQQATLNDFEKALKQAGISPASILSRYYSASLGKVGPVYLGTDLATRILTKKAEIYFQDLYKELMYNPDTIKILNSLLDATKDGVKYVPPEIQKFRAQAILATLGVRVHGNELFEEDVASPTSTLPDQEALSKEPITKEITYDPTGGE